MLLVLSLCGRSHAASAAQGCARRSKKGESLARERSGKGTSKTEKGGGTEGETEREVCHKANRDRSNFCFILCQAENERGSDRLTAPILFTASCQTRSTRRLFVLLSFRDIPRPRTIIPVPSLLLKFLFESFLPRKQTSREDSAIVLHPYLSSFIKRNHPSNY